MSPRFLSQKIAANEPEKKIPSTAAKATTRSEYGASRFPIHFMAHRAFLVMQGIVSMALNSLARSVESLM